MWKILVVFGWVLLVFFGWLANVYTSVMWIANFSSFLFMFCSTLPCFLPPLPQDVASNISILALLLLYTYTQLCLSSIHSPSCRDYIDIFLHF
jgi:hypothetical protein